MKTMRLMGSRREAAEDRFDCPSCEAKAGQPCRSLRPRDDARAIGPPHPKRMRLAREAGY